MMETEEMIELPDSSDFDCKNEKNDLCNSSNGLGEFASLRTDSEVREDELNGENLRQSKDNVGIEDSQPSEGRDFEEGVVCNKSVLQESVEWTETDGVSVKPTENGFLAAQDEGAMSNNKIDGTSILGVKRARMTFEERQPSVHITYNSLTRKSLLKLEEILRQWSDWHAQHGSSSHDQSEVLESGEETYFPALQVGRDKSSAVSFWIDNQATKQLKKEVISLDSNSVPLYDRGYALGLGSDDASGNLERCLEVKDAARCFNCGSYNHSLKDCPKPRNNVAVNNARKQHKTKRNQNTAARNQTRYYQSTPGGKYDGLKPGALDAETRKLLGLGELDPPPWLNRMRELGYPPGYLEPEAEDQPSGITIYADEEAEDDQEDGEILETECTEMRRSMSVKFPGINSPIPENSDEKRWAAAGSSFDPDRSRSHYRSNLLSENLSKGMYHELRSSRDFRDDGPPGVNPEVNPSVSSIYPPRYGRYDSSYTSYNSRGNFLSPRSSTLGRSASDRVRSNPSNHEASHSHDSYSSSPYSTPNSRFSSQHYSSASSENWRNDSRSDFSSDYSSHSRDRADWHHHHRRR